MKKVLSLALALVMMTVVCIPAFANTQYDNGTAGSTTKVTVDGLKDMGEGSYTVTIPAEIEIPWGNEISDVEYSVFCQLQTRKLVKVTASSADGGVMKNVTQTATLKYSLSETSYTTTKSVISASNPEKAIVKVNIPKENWDGASIDKYSGTLTFTAELI